MNRQSHDPITTGVVLAGGRAARMGGRDKGLVDLAGQPMVAHVVRRLRPQVDALAIVANRNLDRYAGFARVVVEDDPPAFRGPLAGIATALRRTSTPWILVVPCDAPLLPTDLARCLRSGARAENTGVAVAVAQGRLQPLFALLHRDVLPALDAFIAEGGRAAHAWFERQPAARVAFSDDPAFANANAPDDCARLAERLRTAYPAGVPTMPTPP